LECLHHASALIGVDATEREGPRRPSGSGSQQVGRRWTLEHDLAVPADEYDRVLDVGDQRIEHGGGGWVGGMPAGECVGGGTRRGRPKALAAGGKTRMRRGCWRTR